jgi:hypothetical protein
VCERERERLRSCVHLSRVCCGQPMDDAALARVCGEASGEPAGEASSELNARLRVRVCRAGARVPSRAHSRCAPPPGTGRAGAWCWCGYAAWAMTDCDSTFFVSHSISLTPRTGHQEPQKPRAGSGQTRHLTPQTRRDPNSTNSIRYRIPGGEPERKHELEPGGPNPKPQARTATHVRTTTRARTTCFQGTIDSWPPASHPPCPLEPPARSNSTHQLPRGPVPRSGPAPALPRAACPSPRRPSRDNARSRVALNRVLPCVCYSYEPHLCLDALVINQSAVPSAAW